MTSAPPNIADPSDNGAEPLAAAAVAGPCGHGEPGKQRKRGAQLEQAIRTACVDELADVGYGCLTIESVASRAQTGKASIYRRWPTKQQLVMDSVTCLMSSPLMQVTAPNLSDDMSTRDALLDLLIRVGTLMSGVEGDAMRSVMGESLRDAEFSGAFECDFFDPRKRSLLTLLERGVARGEVRAEAVDELVVEMLAGALIHRILIRRRRPTRYDYERMLDLLIMPAISPATCAVQKAHP